MATILAGAMVVLAALYLLCFGVLALAVPSRVSTYLLGFAKSLRLHILELSARLLVGAGFVGYASHMQFGRAFFTFGWILVITTLGLALLPWRWHQRFARGCVPIAVRYLPIMGIVSVAAGTFVAWAVTSAAVAQPTEEASSRAYLRESQARSRPQGIAGISVPRHRGLRAAARHKPNPRVA